MAMGMGGGEGCSRRGWRADGPDGIARRTGSRAGRDRASWIRTGATPTTGTIAPLVTYKSRFPYPLNPQEF